MAVSLLTTSLLAKADPYLVELVVFSQPDAQLVPSAPLEQDWEAQSIKLDDTARSDVRSIDPVRYQLTDDVQKLESHGYQVKLHQAWIQPADTNLSVAVHQGASLETDVPLYPTQGLVSLEEEPLTAHVTLWLNHITSHLDEPVSERLQTTRRLRLNETQYLDHKSMGALIRISRP